MLFVCEISEIVQRKIIYRSKLQRGGGLNKDYKVNNLKNKDISVVCSPFTHKYIARTKYDP
jgi:hypothetical protein